VVTFVLTLSLDDVENCESLDLSQECLNNVEADTYWCLSKFLDGIQVGSSMPSVYYLLLLIEFYLLGFLYLCPARNTKDDLQVTRASRPR
jgi:hypothetical protein